MYRYDKAATWSGATAGGVGIVWGMTYIPTAIRWVTPITYSISNVILNPAHVVSFASHIARFIAGWTILLAGEVTCYIVPPLVIGAALGFGVYEAVQHRDDIKNTFVGIGNFFGALFHRPSQAELAAYQQQQEQQQQQPASPQNGR